jgi:hypothetical protein
VNFNEEVELLKDVHFAIREDELEESIMKAVKELRKSHTRSICSAEWDECEGLLYFQGKIYVPPTLDLRQCIVSQHHDTRVAGHPDRFKTLELVTRNYWWPQMSRYIGLYTKTCNLCMRTKNRHRLPIGLLVPAATPTAPWQLVSFNFIVNLPKAHGYNAIMVIVDMLGKHGHFISTHTTITAEGAAHIYFKEVWKHHGMPNTARSDRGPQFVADFMKELCWLAGVQQELSTAYHPQTDGQTEHVNQELEGYLRQWVNYRQDNWDELLPIAEFSYNNKKVHSSTQQTPFMVDMGRNPRMGFEPHAHRSEMEDVNEFVNQMKQVWSEAQGALTKAKDKYTRYYDHRRGVPPDSKPGDKVWLDGTDIKEGRPSKKLSH